MKGFPWAFPRYPRISKNRLNISIRGKTPVPESLNKLAGLRPATLLKKESLAQVFSCEFCEIS